ncbi:MAG: 3-dehydroquinate synthase [Planctomycetes bacterium]|nr:3-dehydroquinate synthase [Planctomycetota bacterium]
MAENIQVKLGERAYAVHVGRGLDGFSAVVPDCTARVIVTDQTVGRLYGQQFSQLLNARVITVPAGEDSKSLRQLESVFAQLLAPRDLVRQSVIIALGGGVIGDLAGFAAATLYRGVRYIQVPTTLLAMVDSSVGGKTAINHIAGKNLIGAFHQPHAVWCDIAFLETLPVREYVSGLAEVVKTAAIGSAALFATLEQEVSAILARNDAVVTRIIADCVRFKAAVVEQDELETTGRRAMLNFGHTLGHALENLYPGRWLHGEAVAIGMVAALRLSVERAALDPGVAERVVRLLQALGLPTNVPAELDAEAAAAVMLGDKKRGGAAVGFVLLKALGEPVVQPCTVDSSLLRTLMGPRDERT